MGSLRGIAICVLFLRLAPGSIAEVERPMGRYTEAPVEIQAVHPPFPVGRFVRPQFPDRTFDIRTYGARDGGQTKNTQAFREAIEACSSAGGGTVEVPGGAWLTGPIHLKSNVNLHLNEGAELHFSDDPQDYLPVVFTRWAGLELYNYSPLIYARDCVNIAVTGPGKLFGHGPQWWKWKEVQEKTARRVYEDQVLRDVPPERRIYGTPAAGLRPQFISPINCRHVLLEGFSVASPGPFWTFDIVYCDNVIVRGLQLRTTGGPNTDGINIDSSRNVLIEYCHIDAGDDAIALKSGINEDGWRVGRPTENVVIRHITALRCHGGIVIGSETSGGIRNVFAHDCDFTGADRGIRLKSNASRGGVVEKLWFRDIRMKNVGREAICINTDYGAFMASQGGKAYPVFRDIVIEDVTCNGAQAAADMRGTRHEPVRNITLTDVSISATRGMHFEWLRGLNLRNVKVTPLQGNPMAFSHCEDVARK